MFRNFFYYNADINYRVENLCYLLREEKKGTDFSQ